MPADRCLHLAIGTAAQFELMLRQMDIIGEWAKAAKRQRSDCGSYPPEKAETISFGSCRLV